MDRAKQVEEIVNELLCLLPESSFAPLQYLNLEKVIETLSVAQAKEMKIKEGFIAQAKQDLVMD